MEVDWTYAEKDRFKHYKACSRLKSSRRETQRKAQKHMAARYHKQIGEDKHHVGRSQEEEPGSCRLGANSRGPVLSPQQITLKKKIKKTLMRVFFFFMKQYSYLLILTESGTLHSPAK